MTKNTNFLNKILILLLLFSLNCIGNVDESILNQEIQSRNREECDPNNPSPETLAKIQAKRIQGPKFKILCPDSTIDETPPVVTATPGEGRYGTSQTITLAKTEEAVIYYTTDGTEPNANSAQYVDRITIDASTTLKFYAVDLSGNASPVKTMLYKIDKSAPNVFVALVSSPAVSGDTSTGSSPAVQIHWQSNMKGSFRVESAGLGKKGSGLYLMGGDLEADTGMVSTIPGSVLELGENRIFIYVTNDLGIMGYTSVDIVREDDPPYPETDLSGGVYGSAQDVTISVNNEIYGVRYIYYTTDGTDPAIAPDEADANGDGTSDICTEYPFGPSAGRRCRIANSSYTSPIHLEPGCVLEAGCTETVTLKFFAQDVAGNVSGVGSVNYEIDMVLPDITNLTLSSRFVRREGSISIQFDSGKDGSYQIVLNPGVGYEDIWDAGPTPLKEGVVTAGASYNIDILGENFPGPSGNTSIVVIRVQDASSGLVGSASFTITRDDIAPVVKTTPAPGTFGYEQIKAMPYYSVAVLDSEQGATVYYTDDGSTPSTASDSVSAGGNYYLLSQADPDEQNNVYCLGNPLCDGAKIKSITLKYFALDAAGNSSPVETAGFTILPTGGSVAITYPQNDIVVPKDGSTAIKFVNNLSETMEYVISQQWGDGCYAQDNTSNPMSPFESGEAIDQGLIESGDLQYKWAFVFEKLFPIEPYNAATYPEVSTSSDGKQDELVVADAGQFTIGDMITYDYSKSVNSDCTSDGCLDKVAKVTDVYIPYQISINPPLPGGSEKQILVRNDTQPSVQAYLYQDGAANELIIANASTSNWSVGNTIIYDPDGINFTTTISSVQVHPTMNARVKFTPVVESDTKALKIVKIWGQENERMVCVYSRVAGETGGWAVTAKNVYSDFSAPQVETFNNPNGIIASSSNVGWITKQHLGNKGWESTVISFKVNKGSGYDGDTSVPAKYYIRKVLDPNTENEKATDFLASGVVNAVGQTIYATVPVDALATGSTNFRIYVEDPFGNVGKSEHSTLDRNDTPPVFALASAVCTTPDQCSINFSGNDPNSISNNKIYCISGSGSCTSTPISPNELYTAIVPLKEDVASTKSAADFGGNLGVNVTNSSFNVNVSGRTDSEILYFPYSWTCGVRDGSGAADLNPSTGCNHVHGVSTDYYYDTCWNTLGSRGDAFLECHEGKGKWIGSFFVDSSGITTSNVSVSINWGSASVTTYSYTGSKIFTYTNQNGLQSSLLVDCNFGDLGNGDGTGGDSGSRQGGCLANSF